MVEYAIAEKAKTSTNARIIRVLTLPYMRYQKKLKICGLKIRLNRLER